MSASPKSLSIPDRMNADRPSHVLTLSCPDAIGIVAAVTKVSAEHDALVTDAQHYREPVASTPILRIVFEAADGGGIDKQRLENRFLDVAHRFSMRWTIDDASRRLRSWALCLTMTRNSAGGVVSVAVLPPSRSHLSASRCRRASS
jgi:formyltetrahydrofolate hydrolase